ncbi:MAG: twin-arginine translocase subunit TatC [Alphaproteobacteria bacterium]|nr:twin-arginine translocase subunit TatC [Alphaproteobacteria bacterium]
MSAPTPLLSHLIELRGRVMRAGLVWMLATGLCYLFAADIYQFFLRPLVGVLGEDSAHRLIATSLPETFVTYLKLALYGGFFVAFPYIAAEAYLFLAPGLFKHERRLIAPYLILAPLLFFLGAAMAYIFVMPKAFAFFLSFEVPRGADGALPLVVEAKVSEYLGLVMHLVLAFGLAFQLPIILTLLVRFGLMRTDTLARGRRYAVVILLTIAAFITPPDILSQVLLFIPLYALYEISILIGRLIEKRRRGEKVSEVEPAAGLP